MRILEHYWMSNKDWWYRDKNLVPRLKEDAPPEAQESYKRYLVPKRRLLEIGNLLFINMQNMKFLFNQTFVKAGRLNLL